MLEFNLSRIFKAAGVLYPRRFLMEKGYKNNTLHRMLRKEVYQLRLTELERMCILFGCTPNDLLEWKPDSEDANKPIPLQQLRMKDDLHIDKMLVQLPYSEQLEVKKFIEQRASMKMEGVGLEEKE